MPRLRGDEGRELPFRLRQIPALQSKGRLFKPRLRSLAPQSAPQTGGHKTNEHQNNSLSDNWIERGSRVSVTCPADPRVASFSGWPGFGALMPVFTPPHCVWLKEL